MWAPETAVRTEAEVVSNQTIVTATSWTDRFVNSCLEMGRQPLSGHVRAATQLVILDTLGAMLAASDSQWPGTQKMKAFVAGEQATGPCLVVGTSLRTAPTISSLANGYLGYALDIETHHGPAVMHAAAGVIPAALAISELKEVTGEAFVSAVALGIEVGCRVSLAIGPNDLYARGFHPSAVAGAFGAAAGAGRLLELDAEQLSRALGLAATQAAGLLAWSSDHTEESRPFNPGIAARNGVTAARLAAEGFGAPHRVFDPDEKYNVFRAWSLDGAGEPARLVDQLGQQYAVEGLTYKRYACCAFLHPALDALLDLMTANALSASQLTAIEMRFPASGAPIIDGNPLRSHQAQYILPIAATRGAVRFADVLFDRSADPEVARLAAVTRIIHDDELDRFYPARYTTRLTLTSDQQQYTRQVDWAKGCPENPLTVDDLLEKYRSLVEPRLGLTLTAEIADLALAIEQGGNLRRLLDRLQVSDPTA